MPFSPWWSTFQPCSKNKLALLLTVLVTARRKVTHQVDSGLLNVTDSGAAGSSERSWIWECCSGTQEAHKMLSPVALSLHAVDRDSSLIWELQLIGAVAVGNGRQVLCLGPFTLEEGWILRSSSCLKLEKYVCSQTNQTLFLQSSLCSKYLTCFTTFIVSIIPDREDTIIILIFLITKIEFLVLVSGAIFSFTLRQNHV